LVQIAKVKATRVKGGKSGGYQPVEKPKRPGGDRRGHQKENGRVGSTYENMTCHVNQSTWGNGDARPNPYLAVQEKKSLREQAEKGNKGN